MITLQKPEVFRIQQSSWGVDQAWYSEHWQREAGCGPATCTNIIWYLARTQKDLSSLWPVEHSSRDNLIDLMKELWNYVTPTYMGVNHPSILGDGAKNFAAERGIKLIPEYLNIPAIIKSRPKKTEVIDFLLHAFSNDLPVAFLNLSNGRLHNLESWHWVTLISLDPDRLVAGILDQGARYEIDLGLWLDSTKMGGGFVTLKVAQTKLK